MNHHDHISEEALKAQNGKTIPLRLEPGGPIIGEATLRYVPESGELISDMKIDDPQVADFLGQETSAIVYKKES
jgi:hypothetical protein